MAIEIRRHEAKILPPQLRGRCLTPSAAVQYYWSSTVCTTAPSRTQHAATMPVTICRATFTSSATSPTTVLPRRSTERSRYAREGFQASTKIRSHLSMIVQGLADHSRREDSGAAFSARRCCRPGVCGSCSGCSRLQHCLLFVIGQRLFVNGKELKNSQNLDRLDGATLWLVVQRRVRGQVSIESYGTSRFPRSLERTLHEVRQGICVQGFAPKLAMEGSGGTYFLYDSRKRTVACFKPRDEEPFAENNPRGMTGRRGVGQTGLRNGIWAGEACEREVAAYILDDKHHFHTVPPTALVEALHPAFAYLQRKQKHSKVGSLQVRAVDSMHS